MEQNNTPLKPDTYLVWSILSTIFCCIPLGIISIVYASKVDSLWGQGRYQEAAAASGKAKKFALWGAISWVIVLLLYFVIAMVAGIGFLAF